jgi:hypothetical protein
VSQVQVVFCVSCSKRPFVWFFSDFYLQNENISIWRAEVKCDFFGLQRSSKFFVFKEFVQSVFVFKKNSLGFFAFKKVLSLTNWYWDFLFLRTIIWITLFSKKCLCPLRIDSQCGQLCDVLETAAAAEQLFKILLLIRTSLINRKRQPLSGGL